MSEEERLRLENELLLTKSKAQMINMYLDVLSIIKEVREFAKLRKEMYERQECMIGQNVIISLLEILDKENK